MHILVRETHSLEEAESAVDLGQSPADLVFLSFSDSDLASLAAAWSDTESDRPTLRLASLAKLRHPLSVDLYVEQVIAHAKTVVIRLLGGLDYWRYGAEQVAAACARRKVPLALLPGDGRADPRLAEFATVAPRDLERLSAFFDHGGGANMDAALGLMAHLAGLADDPGGVAEELPQCGTYNLGEGSEDDPDAPLAAIVFYRSYLLAADLAPLTALADTLRHKGLRVRALYAASLKAPDCAAFTADTLSAWRPAVVISAMGFSARIDNRPSPLEAPGAPVLQVVLSGSNEEAWAASARGLSQADLAMQVVLPEIDGRLLTTAVSFKAVDQDIGPLEFSRTRHAPAAAEIELAASRIAGWARLAATPRHQRRVALVLSDYPGGDGQVAHAVGLDAIASTRQVIHLLREAGYALGEAMPSERELIASLCEATPVATLSLAAYRRLFERLPESARAAVLAAWGEPQDDGALSDGAFAFRMLRLDSLTLAIQPDRGDPLERKQSYHDPDLPPRHAYLAFYLWLREESGADAMIHLGTHGTLEWLPGKAVALSPACFPALLGGGVPVIYPFIVNNPGEAAVAKRRLGAVTIGHLTPPLTTAGSHGAAAELEKIIDEFAAADGLDGRRTALLRGDILARADELGLLRESGVTRDMDEDEALARLDAYLCDVKDLQIRDGLHIFASPPEAKRRAELVKLLAASCPDIAPAKIEARLDASAEREGNALISALDGRFVEPGPAGAPTRGRADVLPSGRNLFTVDPRAVPTRSAMVLAGKAMDDLLRRHLQEHGDWPHAMVIDLWGSTTMRTGGEDLGLALLLIGTRPRWDTSSNRVNGVDIVPLAELGRPRIDVTLRISGLFRDAFEQQIALFDTAVQAIAARHEPDGENPLAAKVRGLAGDEWRRATARIYGTAPGAYGIDVAARLDRGAWHSRDDLGAAYLAASASAYGKDLDGDSDAAGFKARVREADAFVHAQDHREVDLLEGPDFAAHQGGFAAAADLLGGTPALYHADIADPQAPKTRLLAEEIARVVRGRAANPKWIAGMMRHGYRGGAEIARALDGLYAFAAMLPARLDRQFELLFEATLDDERVDEFLRDANPAARAAMAAKFNEAIARGLWQPRRNSVELTLTETGPARPSP